MNGKTDDDYKKQAERCLKSGNIFSALVSMTFVNETEVEEFTCPKCGAPDMDWTCKSCGCDLLDELR